MKNNLIVLYPGFYLMAACAFMIVPIRWFLAWLLAAAIHEICHFLALKCLRVRIIHISIKWNGTYMETEPVFGWKAVISALAGPAGSALMVFLLSVMPRTAICAGFQAIYNLLPIYPLDGGRALYSVLMRIFSEQTARRICTYTKYVSYAFILSIVGVAAIKMGWIMFPVVLLVLVLSKNKKIPCNHSALRVQ